MKLRVFSTYQTLSKHIAKDIKLKLEENPTMLLCIAAGNTSLGILSDLKKMYKEKEIDFSQCNFVAMDEWLNMNLSIKNSCSSFLYENFFKNVNFDPNKIRYVDGLAKDIDNECREIRSFIDSFGGIDYLVLGCGMNGHLALNEPGTDFSSTVHKTELDIVTANVGQKYFENKAELVGGVTIGLKEIFEAKNLILAVNSKSKSEILKKIIESDANIQIPATVLKNAENSQLICDLEAASLLDKNSYMVE